MHALLPRNCLIKSRNGVKSFLRSSLWGFTRRTSALAVLLSFGVGGSISSQPILSGVPTNITVATDPGSCGAVVNFATPTAINSGQVVVPGSQTFTYSGTMESFTVPAGVTSLTIETFGAQGKSAQPGYVGGKGARMKGDFVVTPGDQLILLVGGEGTWPGCCSGGGGGGTFVVKVDLASPDIISVGPFAGTHVTPLIISGGGGGTRAAAQANGNPGVVSNSGTTGSCYNYIGGGFPNTAILGYGGLAPCGSYGSGGGGFKGNGSNDFNYGLGGFSFLSGGAGGTMNCSSGGTYGGYGGGGSGGGCYGGGGGGGYTGGDGGLIAGGGGSYNIGTNQDNASGAREGSGLAVISWTGTPEPTVTQTAGLASGSVFPVGTSTISFTATDALGATTTESFTVTVQDNTPPTVSCQNITVQLVANGEATITPADVQPIGSGSQTFNFTGSVQTFTAPATGTYTLEAWGASGGNVTTYYVTSGGSGGYAKGEITLTAGQTINVYVGGKGEDRFGNHPYSQCAFVPGGWNGGGATRSYGNSTPGGGASDIRIAGTNLSDRVLVASGGGGCGWQYGAGGSGGGLTGNNGTSYFGVGALGGSQSAGGAVGTSYTHCLKTPGSLGNGGDGGGHSAGGGGGGGGYYGGGGGGYADGGGGGSSYIGGVTNGTTTAGVNSGNGKVIISWTTPPALSDNCGIQSQTLSQTTFTCANLGENTVTLTVTDVNGNEATCTAVVTVLDTDNPCNQPPVAACQNITVYTDANCVAVVAAADVDNGSSDPDGDALTYSISPAGPFAVGQHTVTLTVTDPSGEADQCTATITVADNTPPTVATNSFTIQLDAAGNASITPAQVNNGSSDACGIAGYALSTENFTCANVGENTVTLTVTDVNGNASAATAVITVEDNIDPVAVCQSVTVQLDANGQANIGGTSATFYNYSCDRATSGFSNVSQSFTATQTGFITTIGAGIGNWASGSSYGTTITAGGNTVNYGTLAYSDRSAAGYSLCATGNNMAYTTLPAPFFVTAGQLVTVTFTGTGGDMHYQDGQLRMLVTGSTPLAIDGGSSDACGIASVAASQTAFDCSNIGANNVTLTVTDNNGNTSECTAIVTVEDNVDPVVTVQNAVVQLDANGNGSITEADVVSASDACGLLPIQISQTSFGCTNVGANSVTITVTDVNGNAVTETVNVQVEDNVLPVALAQDITVQLDASGTASITPAMVNNGSSDACGIASYTLNTENFTCTNVGENTVTLTVTDNNGNANSATAVITVEDNVAPVVNTNSFTIQLDANGEATITAAQVNNNSADACGIASLSLNQTSFGCSNIGANTVTLTVTDNNGNSASGTAVITVEDNVAPTATTQNITVQLDASGNATITAAEIDNGSADACGIATYSLDITSFDCSNVGANTVDLTVTDNNGNSSSATATVTVEDNVDPVAQAQNITVFLNATGQAATTAAAVNNGSSDACGIATLALSQTAFTCANLGENAVTLTVTDNNSNQNTATATVTVVDNIFPTITCGADITVTAQPNDCTPVVTWTEPVAADNCTFTVTSTHNSGDQFPVGTTTVTYTVEDAAGNKASCSFTVTVNPTPLVITNLSSPTFAGGFNISCNGGGNGSATATVSGGCLPYNYLWSNGQTSATATGLTAGTYSVTVTDANGTSTQQSLTLSEPADLTLEGTFTPEVAHLNAQPETIYLGYGPQSRTLTATADGGVAAYSYSYSWSPAMGLSATTGTSVTASPTVTTSYTVTVTDANGCTETLIHDVYVIDARCGTNPNNPKVLVCHNGQELCLSGNAVLAHLNHGCTVGPCGPARTIEQQVAVEPTLKAYPNPNNGNFTLEVEAAANGKVVLDLLDISGRSLGQLFAGSLEAGEKRAVEVNQQGLPSGIYVVRMLSEGKVTTLRVAIHP